MKRRSWYKEKRFFSFREHPILCIPYSHQPPPHLWHRIVVTSNSDIPKLSSLLSLFLPSRLFLLPDNALCVIINIIDTFHALSSLHKKASPERNGGELILFLRTIASLMFIYALSLVKAWHGYSTRPLPNPSSALVWRVWQTVCTTQTHLLCGL